MDLPELDLKRRERILLEEAQANRITATWHPVTVAGQRVELACVAWSDGVRYGLSCRLQQQIADLLDARIPTPAVLDAAYATWTVVPPFPQPQPIHRTTALREHDADVRRWIAANPDREPYVFAKSWVLHPWCWRQPRPGGPAKPAVTYGWPAPAGYTALRLHQGATNRNLRVVQPLSPVHDVDHSDYSQLCWVARGPALLWAELPADRHPLLDRAEPAPPPEPGPAPRVTQPGERDAAGSSDGPVRRWQRWLLAKGYALPRFGADGDHGGETEAVTILALEDHPELRSQRPDLSGGPPSSRPRAGLPPWRDAALTPGKRAVAWMREQQRLGVKEQPPGSNKGPEIGEWLSHCTREGQGAGFGPALARQGANWCAAFTCEAALVSRLEGDPAPVHRHRCSGVELEADAKKSGSWRPVSMIVSGVFAPEEGDICILPRGAPGSWQRHVCRFVRWLEPGKLLETIGGNEENAIRLTRRRVNDLIGIIELPAPARPVVGAPSEPPPPPPADPPVEDGDQLTARAWADMDPSPWELGVAHGVRGSTRRWVCKDDGIHIVGEEGPLRTPGRPVTLGRVRDAYGAIRASASAATGVDVRVLAAMVATESGLNARAERHEPHLRDYTLGAAQTLTQTALAMARRLGLSSPKRAVPDGGSLDEWRAFLFEPKNAILCGALYLAHNDERFGLRGDPVMAYACYNAGSPRVRADNPWGMAYFFKRKADGTVAYDAVDTFCRWYGDACEVWGMA
jgi:hypothetical protein